ncbi:MAG: GNAT family N-acetyltransferase [Ignavibacteria bacterium]|nr:GNAT family N-acetyltransferase [Ignavibacteria bacterium]
MNEVSIRFAEKQDVPVILGLIKEIAEYEKLSHEVIATEDSLSNALFGPEKVAEVLLMTIEGQLAGYALFFHNFSTFIGKKGLYLEDIYVKPGFRGQGAGRVLFNSVRKLAAERDCGRMEWAVLNWNTPAIEFYERAGAKPQSEWTVYRLTEENILPR